jgi:hypothetical protein
MTQFYDWVCQQNQLPFNLTGLSKTRSLLKDIFKRATIFAKLVLGIPAQASDKNHVAINAFGALIRPAFVSLRQMT